MGRAGRAVRHLPCALPATHLLGSTRVAARYPR
jgi:hypothetical protein